MLGLHFVWLFPLKSVLLSHKETNLHVQSTGKIALQG